MTAVTQLLFKLGGRIRYLGRVVGHYKYLGLNINGKFMVAKKQLYAKEK